MGVLIAYHSLSDRAHNMYSFTAHMRDSRENILSSISYTEWEKFIHPCYEKKNLSPT